MPKILIVHPEGNIKNNPNLFAIARMMVERGCEVLVYSRFRAGIYQGDIFQGARFVYFGESVKEISKIEKRFKDENIRFVIGIDDEGIYKAHKIAAFLRVPYLFLSYEILFDHEIRRIGCRADHRNKRRAKKAVRGIQCAVVQDTTRRSLLSREYGIPEKKILLMPVANSGSHLLSSSHYFHDKLGIPSEKHILLYMGWMDAAQEQRMVGFAPYMPDNWVLVAHSRYEYSLTVESEYIGKKVFFSCDSPIESIDEIGKMLSDCQVGFCAYQPSSDSIYTGDNIRYIGLSSGKTSTFLQYGIPVVVENMNIWDELVKKYHFGYELKDVADLTRLNEIATEETRQNAISFFEEHLDAAVFFPAVWRIISNHLKPSHFNRCTYWRYCWGMYHEQYMQKFKNQVKSILHINK